MRGVPIGADSDRKAASKMHLLQILTSRITGVPLQSRSTGGLIWAAAAVLMRSDGAGDGIDFTLSYFVWGSAAALLSVGVPLDGTGTMPDWETTRGVLMWMVPVAMFMVIPPAFAIMWGATILSPGLLALLFMTEISAAAITAAIWAGEPFELRELLGVILISAAGVFEPVLNWSRRSARASELGR